MQTKRMDRPTRRWMARLGIAAAVFAVQAATGSGLWSPAGIAAEGSPAVEPCLATAAFVTTAFPMGEAQFARKRS